MNVCVVVPTIREKSVQEFLESWREDFRDHHVIVVEDNPVRSFKLPNWVTHVCWEDIDADLKSDGWIIPRRSGAIRNYGNLLASRIHGLDMIVNLDDDCMPEERVLQRRGDFLESHWNMLQTPGGTLPVFDTMHGLTKWSMRPRGYPKHQKQAITVLNHGLWNGVPDIDGETQLLHQGVTVDFDWHTRQVPPGVLFPMSAMNIAFRPELLPAMYNLPMGQGQPFHRFDDIWCGLIMKKACDAMGWSVRSGSPMIRHIRASDAKRNAELEAPGIVENERVWQNVAGAVILNKDNLKTLDDWLTAITLSLLLGAEKQIPYWERACEASQIWRRLVTDGSCR